MELFDTVNQAGHEQIVFCHNKDVDLRDIIAIHDTTLGPALGGTRMWPYATEEEALRDVLRLSRGMTYKRRARYTQWRHAVAHQMPLILSSIAVTTRSTSASPCVAPTYQRPADTL